MNGRVAAANGQPEGGLSRTINVILRNQGPPVLSSSVPAHVASGIRKRAEKARQPGEH
ncbi:hypothetical protein GRF59_01165 [Paenibacillus sp. HJL G12]|uniref:Uncharacterized protein n=1 Tax=Paenibacillus dendrobii TaxID=2691084 RepID=A0A7X3IE41_9BACL|nr:hypothetical protein [Paenibacillus dendrobii]MWV42228.1 hypothetical protein [Paenibacillus dendrobii]